MPCALAVFALNCFTKSMMFTPWGPSAVPTGGAGVAAPAGIWIFTIATTCFFATTSSQALSEVGVKNHAGRGISHQLRRGSWLELRDLGELELDGGLPPKDVDEDLELELVLVDLGDHAGEVGEGALAHPDALAHLVLEARLGALRG